MNDLKMLLLIALRVIEGQLSLYSLYTVQLILDFVATNETENLNNKIKFNTK